MKIIGITGTDGKTTTSLILKQLLSSKYNVGYIGTNGIMYNNTTIPTINTTPSNELLQRYIKNMKDTNVDFCIIEVSSHGIKQNRIKDILFDSAIFTNISHEHLDYHNSLDEYFNTKLQLFKKTSVNVINNDDPYSNYIKELKPKYITYGLNYNSDYKATIKDMNFDNTIFDLNVLDFISENIETNYIGEYNVYNIISSIALSNYYGISLQECFKILRNLEKVSGRFEKINNEKDINIIVDFAHTPNGLFNILNTSKAFTKNKTIIVFGSAGNKDKSKRPLMGNVVFELADEIILTSEDPRDELPEEIIKEIVGKNSKKHYVVIDRKEAIKKALTIAKRGDTILVTGKGNENTQELKDYTIPHNDIVEIKEAINILL